MKYLISILLLLSFSVSYAQVDVPIDSLKKCSYQYLAVIPHYPIKDSFVQLGGSGFFYKEKSQTYYLSAKHVLGAFESTCERRVSKGDKGQELVYLDKKQMEVITVDASNIRDTYTCTAVNTSVDLAAVKIKDELPKGIQTVNRFLSNYVLEQNYIGDILIVGFPQVDIKHSSDGGTILSDVSSYKIPKGTYQFKNNFHIKINGQWVRDTINYAILPVGGFPKGDSLNGYSGSPAFIKDSITDKWMFLGVFVAASENANSLMFVKPRFIHEAVKKAL